MSKQGRVRPRWWQAFARLFAASDARNDGRVRLPPDVRKLVQQAQEAGPHALSSATAVRANAAAAVLEFMRENDVGGRGAATSTRRQLVVVHSMGHPSPISIPVSFPGRNIDGASFMTDAELKLDLLIPRQSAPWDEPGVDVMALYWTMRFREAEDAA
ncbi:hypothetical protein [Amycolatopsis sp. H20-H5]|uniref:hypothetical protein n=1 Tax=Amycolatopsis sp. H20-H5 TaxID=3046309 RepID=UPI002DBCB2D2|nr:hypothetical protein [Amycolatopsis sp. H20-H5]MEC3977869.1 hypothetical protein [Amycolatopsis sp. H20-H5]